MIVVSEVDVTYDTAEALIRALSSRLEARGAVTSRFAEAVVERERKSPTGLPLAGGSAAVPHADPDLVRKSAIAVATLAAPVEFRQMGSPEISLRVDVVFLLALKTREDAQSTLVGLLRTLEGAKNRDELRDVARRISDSGGVA